MAVLRLISCDIQYDTELAHFIQVTKVEVVTMTEVEQPYVETQIIVPWGHIAAITYGPSTGKPVLMVHGALDNAGTFIRLMKYLPLDYYYISIDLPGHGRSSHFPSWMALHFADYVNALYYILEALQWETCIYIGHSLGAQIGTVFSILQPSRLEKIICFDGFVPTMLRSNDFLKNFKDPFTFAEKALNNEELKSYRSKLYSKEDILYALQYRRFAVLNFNAAEALFKRAVTKINDRYKYNRDDRLKRPKFVSMNAELIIDIIREISVPMHIFFSKSSLLKDVDYSILIKTIKSINPEIQLQITYMDGNHDFHNNNPETVAPLVCNILNSNLLSKL